jgi:hypothetical protein
MENTLAFIHGIFYSLTGIWPLVSRRSFERVTGPKTDWWLVQTVGVLVLMAGVVLILAGVRSAVTLELFFLAIGFAGAFAAIDTFHWSAGRISAVYLLDAVFEVILGTLWTICLLAKY